MNIIDPDCLAILHKWKRGEISREEAQKEVDKHRGKIAVQLFAGGFSIRHLPVRTTTS